MEGTSAAGSVAHSEDMGSCTAGEVLEEMPKTQQETGYGYGEQGLSGVSVSLSVLPHAYVTSLSHSCSEGLLVPSPTPLRKEETWGGRVGTATCAVSLCAGAVDGACSRAALCDSTVAIGAGDAAACVRACAVSVARIAAVAL